MNPQQILTNAQDALTARRVFGDPIQTAGATILPVAVVGGGGAGGGKGTEEGGAGFGLRAKPAGVFVIRNGDAAWRPALDLNRVILGGQLVAVSALLTLRPILMRWFARRSGQVPAM
jgi:uncharacterized spore protein YtfJ